MLTSIGHEPPLNQVPLKFLEPLVTQSQKIPIEDHFIEHAPNHLLALFHSTFNPKENPKIPSAEYGSLIQEKECLIPSVRATTSAHL